MSTDYEIDFEIDTLKIGQALLANPQFMTALTEAIRKTILQQMRQNPAQFGLNKRAVSGYSKG